MRTPLQIASDVAEALAAAAPGPELRSTVGRLPDGWTLDGEDADGGRHYVIVRPVDTAPDFAGDGKTITDAALVTIDLYEHEAHEDPARVVAIITAIDRVKLPGHSYAGRLEGLTRAPDPDADDVVRHVGTARYPVSR